MVGDLRELLRQGVERAIILSMNGIGVELVVDGMRGRRQGGADRRHEADLRVGGHQPHPGWAAGRQRFGRTRVSRPLLGEGDLGSQSFYVCPWATAVFRVRKSSRAV